MVARIQDCSFVFVLKIPSIEFYGLVFVISGNLLFRLKLEWTKELIVTGKVHRYANCGAFVCAVACFQLIFVCFMALHLWSVNIRKKNKIATAEIPKHQRQMRHNERQQANKDESKRWKIKPATRRMHVLTELITAVLFHKLLNGKKMLLQQ